MAADTVTLSAAKVGKLAENGLRRIGFETDEAEAIADHLVESELMGYPALGLSRVLTIAEHPLTGKPRAPISVTRDSANSARVDGGNHVGMYAVRHAAEIVTEKVQDSGLALVGVHNTFLSGRNAYYVDIIARAGFASVHLACSPPVVSPLGGKAPAFGTNTIAFGLPRRPHPLIIDIATSATNVGDLKLAARLGQELPDMVAVDSQGHTTTDPIAALSGAILPFGGHKGYALSFAAQALGLLGGSALTRGQTQDFGFLFLAFDPSLLLPADALQDQLDDLVARIKATPRQPGVAEIRVPSERAYAVRARKLIEGIEIPLAIVTQIEKL